MQVEVYADIVFLVNYIMDFFIFLIVTKLIKKKIIYKKIILGALCSSILYCIVIFVPMLRDTYNFLGAFLILSAGILIAFTPHGIKEFFKLVLFAHIVAFSLGGAGMALFYYTDFPKTIGNMLNIRINNFPFKVLLSATATVYIVIKLWLGIVKNIFTKNKVIFLVKIYLNNTYVILNALVDTGNSLVDPITLQPVLVAEFSEIKQLLSDEIKLIYYEKKDNNLMGVLNSVSDSEIAQRIRLIPFSSLGASGTLLGFKADMVEISDEREKTILNNVVIAIYNSALSEDGQYQALINPEVFGRKGEKYKV